jgi:GNAT superfamily N-acetyltransferase
MPKSSDGQSRADADDWDTSFSISFGVDSKLYSNDSSGYIEEIEAQIWAESERDDVEDKIVGTVRALRIYSGRVLNENGSLWDVCDGFNQCSSDCYSTLFDKGQDFKPEVEEMFPNTFGGDVLCIEAVCIVPEFRGLGLGLLAARRTMDLFEPEDGLVVLTPFPLQFNSHHRRGGKPKADFSGFASDEKQGITKLQAYWAKLGFRPIPGSDMWALATSAVHPTFTELEGQA